VAGRPANALCGLVRLASFVLGTLGLGPTWVGSVGREAWRHSVTVNDPLPAYPRCDALLPTGARILVVGEGRAWGCPRPHHVGSPYDRQLVQAFIEEASSAAERVNRLRSAGFTHLLTNLGEVGRLGGPDFRVLRVETPTLAVGGGNSCRRSRHPCFGRAPSRFALCWESGPSRTPSCGRLGCREREGVGGGAQSAARGA